MHQELPLSNQKLQHKGRLVPWKIDELIIEVVLAFRLMAVMVSTSPARKRCCIASSSAMSIPTKRLPRVAEELAHRGISWSEEIPSMIEELGSPSEVGC